LKGPTVIHHHHFRDTLSFLRPTCSAAVRASTRPSRPAIKNSYKRNISPVRVPKLKS
jgi:hypothetical protein